MSSLGGDNQVLAKIQTGSKDREDKLKYAKERQKEERQKKIEELKVHAEAAQKYREQKEEERRRRMEEIKIKDLEKRQQVEERKKAIMEADKERREYILRKNQERACRIEIKKREQNSLGFAFGSSTPRLLEPATFGMVSPSTFWCNRRSTSISNVAGCSLSRRSSERELVEIGSKKRSTSANGSDGSRSGNVTPKKVATSRPSSAMSSSATSTSGNLIRRSTQDSRKPRPVSIAGTAVSFDEISSKKVNTASPLSNVSTPKRIGNLMSTSLTHTFSNEEKRHPSQRDTIIPNASTPKPMSVRTVSADRLNGVDKKPLKGTSLTQTTYSKLNFSYTNDNSKTDSPKKNSENKCEEIIEPLVSESNDICPQNPEKSIPEMVIEKEYIESADTSINNQPEISDVMNSSIIGKNKITTEEEAKAALAERRRLAREEAERQAALERQRIEAEKLIELQRLQEEAEQQRQFEEEATRLAEEQRRAEEQRLNQAIEEAKRREDDEKRKREEDDRQRYEREENEKKVKEEADRQRLEIVERLKKEEKEREERRKRVEAIMSRTRKGTASSTNSIKENHSNNKRADGDCPQPQENSISSVSLTPDVTITNSYTSSNDTNAETYNSDIIHTDNSLSTKFSNILINENLKHDQQPQMMDVLKSKISAELEGNNYKLPNSITLATVTNGNSHIENLNKNDLILADFSKSETSDLLELNKNTNERNSSNFNNNNLISKSLVTEARVNNDLSIL